MNPERYSPETVLAVQAWTPGLMSFRLSRPEGYRFTAGQFARLGLKRKATPPAAEAEIIWRAYSIASATADPFLEFCSVLLPEGEFTTELARLAPGDAVYIERASYGFLTTAGFAPGKDLWMIATGTGLAPFISMALEPSIWAEYEHLVVVHSVRELAELTYRQKLADLRNDPAFGASGIALHYVPIVTREPHPGGLTERIPQLLADGRLEAAAGVTLDVARSRVLLCGNPAMVAEVRAFLTPLGYATARRTRPGTLAVENYW